MVRHLLTAAAVLAATLVSGCKKEIYHGLSELEANEIVVTLAEHGIPADKLPDAGGQQGGKKGAAYMIAVEETWAVDAKRVLLKEQLPRPQEKGLLDMFASPSMIPTETEEKARYLTAIQGELAASLEQVDGVVDAKVHLVLPESNPLASGDLTTARSAVLIKYRGKLADEAKEADKVADERNKYRDMLVSLGGDLTRLRTMLVRDLPESNKIEKSALVALDTYFAEKRGDDPDAKEARGHFTRLKEASLKRDGVLRQMEALPKIKDLDGQLRRIQDLELDALPFTSAAVRSLIARATPRLSEDEVTVEFTRVQPKPLREKMGTPAGPKYLTQTNFLIVSGIAAGLAATLAGLGFYILSLRKQLTQARQAAAKAVGSMSGSAPPAA